MENEEEVVNQVNTQQQVSVSAESHPVNVELHSEAELQNEESAHSEPKISTRNNDEELPDGDMQREPEPESSNMEIRTKPRLSKYVKRHHPTDQMTRMLDQ